MTVFLYETVLIETCIKILRLIKCIREFNFIHVWTRLMAINQTLSTKYLTFSSFFADKEDMSAVDALNTQRAIDEKGIETARIRLAALTWFQYNHARYIRNNEWIYERIAVSFVTHSAHIPSLKFRRRSLLLFDKNI